MYKEIGSSRFLSVGIGTAGFGGKFDSDYGDDDSCVHMIRSGVDAGLTFIDTAENYGGGHTEELVGRAIKGVRDKVFIATKVSPDHLKFYDVIGSCEGSLKRLEVDYIDLYQIHWPNPTVPLEETMDALYKLVHSGKIRYIGVSNFSTELVFKFKTHDTERRFVSCQDEYNLVNCSNSLLSEFDDLMHIAYSPFSFMNRILAGRDFLEMLSNKYDMSVYQVVLNYLVVHLGLMVIPKMSSEKHLVENISSMDFRLLDSEYQMMGSIPFGFRREIDTSLIDVDILGSTVFCPSVEELSLIYIFGDREIKPIKVVLCASGRYRVVEGRVRFLAWRLAIPSIPIPSIIVKEM